MYAIVLKAADLIPHQIKDHYILQEEKKRDPKYFRKKILASRQ